MKRHVCFVSFFAILWLSIFFPKYALPQLILGQYEDEAPFRTWNTLGISTGASLAMGEARFTLASDCSVALTNPALLSNLPKITFSLSSCVSAASFFKYSIINTGPLYNEENMSQGFYALDFAGVSVNLKEWALALNIGLLENYDRPRVESKYPASGQVQYMLNLDQEGILKNINFSLSRKLGKNFSVGIGFNYIYGYLEKNIEEKWTKSNITITDKKSHDFKGFYVNGGLVVYLSDALTVAGVFRTPYTKKSDSKSLLRYYSPQGKTDIKIEASAQNSYKQPLVVGLGLSYKFSKVFKAAADLSFFNWAKYNVYYFEEELERDFKDVVKISAGAEYMSSIWAFNQEIKAPLRIGISYDPQPMREPNSHYLYFSFGAGIYVGKFLLDAGALIGNERGSGNALAARRIAFSLSFRM